MDCWKIIQLPVNVRQKKEKIFFSQSIIFFFKDRFWNEIVKINSTNQVIHWLIYW